MSELSKALLIALMFAALFRYIYGTSILEMFIEGL